MAIEFSGDEKGLRQQLEDLLADQRSLAAKQDALHLRDIEVREEIAQVRAALEDAFRAALGEMRPDPTPEPERRAASTVRPDRSRNVDLARG